MADSSWLFTASPAASSFRDIELLHLQHCLHPLGVLDQVEQARGNNLPAQAEFVVDPTTLNLCAAVRQFRIVIVDLFLRNRIAGRKIKLL
jgi:hypothetical protein